MNIIRRNSDMEQLRTGERRVGMFSECTLYRFSLEIAWTDDRGLVQFVGLNPSTADENVNDPTVKRCCDFARRWGYGGIVMTNLFSLRATDPRVMMSHPEPCLFDQNDRELVIMAARCAKVVACWGVHGTRLNRDRKVVRLLGNELYALRLTRDGHPQHPLYLPGNLNPVLVSELQAEKEKWQNEKASTLYEEQFLRASKRGFQGL